MEEIYPVNSQPARVPGGSVSVGNLEADYFTRVNVPDHEHLAGFRVVVPANPAIIAPNVRHVGPDITRSTA